MDDLRLIIGAAIGSGVVTALAGWQVHRDMRALAEWCRRLSYHVGFTEPVPMPAPKEH